MAKRPKHRFTEYVKNPDLFREETRERAVKPAKGGRLAEVVAILYTRQLEYEERLELEAAGEKAVPVLVAALRDPAFMFHLYGESVLAGSALESACDLLEPFAEPPAKVLEPALKHENELFRYRALYHLARCGNDDAIPALRHGLASESERCRLYSLMGLEFLAQTGRGSRRFRKAMFDAAVPLLEDFEYGPAEHAPRALLVLDRDRAVKVLLSDFVFDGANPNCFEVLRALKDAQVPVPAKRLRKVLSELRDGADEFPLDRAYGDGLMLLARTEGEAASDLIADAQEWGNEYLKTAAAEAALLVAGVTDAYAVAFRRYRRKGVVGLSEPQLYFLTLTWLDDEVRNGGFSQYFFNSAGELAGYAVAAAEAVGAPKLARIIEKAVSLFGSDGPATDRDERMDQLSALRLPALSKLDTRYYNCPDDLRGLLPLYAANHAKEFRSRARRG